MSLKRTLHFAWGLFMGTTVPYVKPARRPLWPSVGQPVDASFALFMGGTGNCGILFDSKRTVLINANSGAGAVDLRAYLGMLTAGAVEEIVGLAARAEFVAGASVFETARLVTSGSEVLQVPGDERIRVETVTVTGESTLVATLERRGWVFLGPLFFNRIHPPLSRSCEIKAWASHLEALATQRPDAKFVPAEGDIGNADDLREFARYLRDLSNHDIEFSACRARYDWREIVGITSLEENFELLRQRSRRL